MKRKLEMDEIREGMYITILRGKIEYRMFPGPDGPKMARKERDYYNGKVLEVMSLDLPYIVVTVHEPRGSRVDTLDLRTIEIMRLTSKYVSTLLPDLELGKDSFWDEIKDTSLEEADTDIEEIFKDL